MKEIVSIILWSILLIATAAEIAGTPRDSNFKNTGGYDSTRVEAQLMVNVKEGTKTVHFIRDNNDPRVVTKTYVLKHADPYELRDYLRSMVQAKQVGNTSQQQQFPLNAVNGGNGTPATNAGIGTDQAATVAATVSAPVLTTPATAQPGYNPPLQLGSNTAVECLKYVDGTGLLIVSAEEYRFKDHENGMGLDSIIEFLDKPGMGTSTGTQIFFYLPKFVPARNLMSLIQNVGMNIYDVTELWQGQDVVAYDPDLNWLIFDVSNYSCENVAALLAKYDVPIPQVRMKITLVEVFQEDDDKIGLDFQAWKNNAGTDFFSAGGRMRNNWTALFNTAGVMNKSYGSERTSFYNFNPKWNTRYIDFLVSKGKAKVSYSGELLIRNNTPAELNRTTQIFYIDVSKAAPDAITLPDTGVGPYELLDAIIGTIKTKLGTTAETVDQGNFPVAKGNQQITTVSSGYGFSMKVSNASVNLKETSFRVSLSNTSLIGFQSNGQPRISSPSVVDLQISLPHGKDRFVIGGLKKQESVTSSTGIPWLSDIPILGYLFSSKTTSVKHSELIIMAECSLDMPENVDFYTAQVKNTSNQP